MYQEIQVEPSAPSYDWLWIVVFLVIVAFVVFLIWLLRERRVEGTINFSTFLSGNQVVPPVQTQASGGGSLALGELESYLDFNISMGGFAQGTTVTTVSFIQGSSGPVVKNLTSYLVGPNSSGVYTVKGRWSVTDADPLTTTFISNLKADNIYVNVTTNMFPNGEIRGRVFRLLT